MVAFLHLPNITSSYQSIIDLAHIILPEFDMLSVTLRRNSHD